MQGDLQQKMKKVELEIKTEFIYFNPAEDLITFKDGNLNQVGVYLKYIVELLAERHRY